MQVDASKLLGDEIEQPAEVPRRSGVTLPTAVGLDNPPRVAKGLIFGRLLAQTTDRRVAHVVGPSDIGQHLSCLTASDCFPALMARQLWLATEDNPLAFARSRPSPVRVRISSRSNSANPPNTVSIKRPCAVVVSAHVSLRDLNPAPFSAIVPSRLSRSRVDRARRSSRVTTNTSPFARTAIRRASCLRSDRAQLIFSWNIFLHFAAFSSANCADNDWPSVLTRAYP
jgi:hypothetical protein